MPFDNDSKLAFSKKGNLCIFDLKKSSCALTKTCISPLRHCVKAQLDLSNKEGGNNLESLTLSKSRFGSRFLWSLVRDKQKKYIYGFRLNEGNEIEKFALYKFKLPHSLKEATRVSLLKKAKGEYTFVVSTSLKKPESSLYRVRYKKSPQNTKAKDGLNHESYSLKEVTPLSSYAREVAGVRPSHQKQKKTKALDFIDLDGVYKQH